MTDFEAFADGRRPIAKSTDDFVYSDPTRSITEMQVEIRRDNGC